MYFCLEQPKPELIVENLILRFKRYSVLRVSVKEGIPLWEDEGSKVSKAETVAVMIGSHPEFLMHR